MEVRHTPFAFFLVKKHKFKTSPGTVYGIFGYWLFIILLQNNRSTLENQLFLYFYKELA